MDSPELVSLLEKTSAIEEKDFENIAMETLAKNNLSSHHLVVVREREPLHYHAEHDGWALVIKGEADFLLGEEWMVLRPGRSVYIPRGVRHKAIRRGPEAIAAFVVFTPPYDGSDMVLVREE
jgi:mannose-6-phosphate isomerase-like protein (cupin superfamily)